MASNQQQNTSIKIKLSQMYCPFTWDILESVQNESLLEINNYNITDGSIHEASCDLELLLNYLLKCYKAVLSADNNVAITCLENAEKLLMDIQQQVDPFQTIRAIEHVYYATKCFFLYEANKMDELEEILHNIANVDNFNDEEICTLYGCQSVIWSYLFNSGINKAIENSKKAIEKNQDYPLWHFILAKNLRRQRRSTQISSTPSDMERMHFEMAYAISKNSVYGVYYLNMRIEMFYSSVRKPDYLRSKSNNEKEVLEIAKQILKGKPTNCTVLLKLALIFLRASISHEVLIKQCLNTVQKIKPNDATYLHYTGLLYKSHGDYKEAINYFKKAADLNNFAADMCYVEYGWEVAEVEPLQHLMKMLERYKYSSTSRQIAIHLAIAIIYYSLHKDIPTAAKYFLKALTIDPQNRKFQTFYKFLNFRTTSVATFLNDTFLPNTKRYRAIDSALDETCREIKGFLNIRNIENLAEELKPLSMKLK